LLKTLKAESQEIAQLQMCSLLVKPLQLLLLLLLQSLEACRWMFGTCFCGTLLAAGVRLKELMKSGRKLTFVYIFLS
jgi:hypothetical protein